MVNPEVQNKNEKEVNFKISNYLKQRTKLSATAAS